MTFIFVSPATGTHTHVEPRGQDEHVEWVLQAISSQEVEICASLRGLDWTC